MGEAPQFSLQLIMFLSVYAITLFLLYITVIPTYFGIQTQAIWDAFNSKGTETSFLSIIGNVVKIFATTYASLGLWNILFFAPFLLSVAFIFIAMAWPNWA